MTFIEQDYKKYALILADGTIRVACDQNDPKAVKREFEKSDGTKVIKYEYVYKGLKGIIKDMAFFDADFGTQLNLTMQSEGEEAVILSVNCSNNFGQDIMKKLPSVDQSIEVEFKPWAFTDDKGKSRKGCVVEQMGNKINNFFYDEAKKENINGFPNPEGDTKKFKSDDWKMYFLQVKKFLIQYTQDNVIKHGDDINVDKAFE